MSSPLLSVIIPTHNRPEILRACLEHLERQTIADQLEVIVVSDGPDEQTKSIVVGALHAMPLVKYFDIPKSHQGVARNRGMQEATAPVILFIGDDIFLASDACALHLQAHSSPLPRRAERGVGEGLGVGVLGFTTWDPAVGITPVMEWLEHSGWQFGYPMIEPFNHSTIPSAIQHHFTYTSNISLPTAIAKKFPFREDVTLYGWEDVEWGWRLKNAGLPPGALGGAQGGVELFYEPDARALHHHHMTMEDSLKRMETLGKSAVIMDRIAPELHLVPRGWKLLKYRIASLLPTMRGRHSRAFVRGCASAVCASL